MAFRINGAPGSPCGLVNCHDSPAEVVVPHQAHDPGRLIVEQIRRTAAHDGVDTDRRVKRTEEMGKLVRENRFRAVASEGFGPVACRHDHGESAERAACDGTKPLRGNGPESILSHELAHLFGAFHPAISVDSVMRGGPPDLFDDQTTRVMRLMRNYDFRRGIMAVDEGTRRAWRAIYAEGHQRNDEANPLVMAITNVGLELARSGKPAEGETALREAIKIDQLLVEPHVVLGTIHAQRGLFEDAVREFRLAKSLSTTHVGARTELGLNLLRLGKDQEALSELEIVLRMDPQTARARIGLCAALARRDRLDEAIRECTEAIRFAPKDAAAFSARGHAYERKGELDRAILDYDQAIRLSPSFAAAFNGRGSVYRRKGDLDRAIQDFDQAIRLQ